MRKKPTLTRKKTEIPVGEKEEKNSTRWKESRLEKKGMDHAILSVLSFYKGWLLVPKSSSDARKLVSTELQSGGGDFPSKPSGRLTRGGPRKHTCAPFRKWEEKN